MKILSHRGYWKRSSEKNTPTAFERSFNLGFGTETDIRDQDGKIVISHDPAMGKCTDLSTLVKITPRSLTLALNVKSDGLVNNALEILKEHGHENYFFFDMSIPDQLSYIARGAPHAIRVSDVEPWNDTLATHATHIWLDAFYNEWYEAEAIETLLEKGKEIVVVSAELHKRDNVKQWALLKSFETHPLLMLCTDEPELAADYFR